jgi:hypothetical protein
MEQRDRATPVMKTFFRIAFLATVLALTGAGASAAEPHTLPWPSQALPPFSITTVWDTPPESGPTAFFRLEGSGVTLELGTLRPFVIAAATDPHPAIPGALFLRHGRTMDGWLAFTLFEKGAFMDSPSEANLAAYLAGIVASADPQRGRNVTVLEPPAPIDRRELLIGLRPLSLSWRTDDAAAKTSVTRGDWFFELEGGRILVVSVVAGSAGFEGVRNAALAVLRDAALVH